MALSLDSAHFSQLEEEYSRNPLNASLRVHLFEESHPNDLDSKDKCGGNEQYMNIEICLPQKLLHLSDDSTVKTHVILVADRSGSMSGNPWEQVRRALIHVVEDSLKDDSIHVDVVTYESHATHVSYTSRDYRQVLGDIDAGGGTDFNKAFLKVDDVIAGNSDDQLSKVVVIFMTDGIGNSEENCVQWGVRLSKLDKDVTVHTVGFSENHDLKCLLSLSQVGSTKGMYQYCEPGHGPEALKAKLKDLYEFVSISCSSTFELEVEMIGSNQLVDLGVHRPKATIQGEITHSAPSRFCTNTWICLQDEKSLKDTKMFILITLRKGKQSCQLRIPVAIEDIHRKKKNMAGEVVWVMVFAKNTDILTVEFVNTVEANKEIGDIESRLDNLQKQAEKTPEFGENVTAEMRNLLTGIISENKARIEKVSGLVSRYDGGETQSVSMLAGVQDLRCEVQIRQTSKLHRLHEIMEKVTPKNLVMDEADGRKLKDLSVRGDESDMLSQEVESFYSCALSQNSIKDILFNKDEAENVLGFGLAIEGQGDAPDAIRIQGISGTFVSRTYIYYTFDNMITVKGYPTDKEGFNFMNHRQGDLMPVNAWLPLYITKSHWKRVKLLIKPTLGYFYTLDPMRYDEEQLGVFFTVLGTMIGHLNEENVRDRQLNLVFAVQRICSAIVLQFGWLEKIRAVVENFMESPEGRKEDAIPNLYTLIGFLVSMPRFAIKSLLGYDAKPSLRHTQEPDGTSNRLPKKARAFWFAVIIECLQRASAFAFRTVSSARLNGVVGRLVIAKENTTSSEVSCRGSSLATLVESCKTLQAKKTKEIKLVPCKVAPAPVFCPAVIETDHSEDMDKAMDMWAQDKCGLNTYQHQADEVSKAKEDINNWLHNIRQKLLARAEPDLDQIDSSVLDVTAKLMEVLRRSCFPSLNVFPGFIAFVDHWLKFEKDFMEMDMNGGLPPEHWLSDVKGVVSEVDAKMKEFLKDHAGQAANGTMSTNTDTSGRSVPEDIADDKDDSELQHKTKVTQDPMTTDVLLTVILNIIDPDMNQMNFIRAVLCQVINRHTDNKTTQASTGEKAKDLCHLENVPEILREVHAKLHVNAVMKVADKDLYQRANHSMLQAETIWAFIGYLMNTYKDRSEGFRGLITSMMKRNRATPIPLLADKLRVLFSGKWDDCVVFANGNIWIPGEQRAKRFKELVGPETWSQIENELQSSIQPHVYRESDKPNRHGRTYPHN